MLAPTFSRSFRSSQHEVMDDPEVSEGEYRRCLRELAQVNRFTFTHRPVIRWLARRLVPGKPVVILDVAFGQGDLLRAIWHWARARGLEVQLYGIDLNPRSAETAREATPAEMNITFQTGDVFSHLPEVKPDFIVSSQFTHHLDDEQVVRFVRWLEDTARIGWFLTDLERSPIAYRAFPLLCAVSGWHDIVRHDGQVSIARSFRREEWEQLVSGAGVQARVRRSFPFRLSITNNDA